MSSKFPLLVKQDSTQVVVDGKRIKIEALCQHFHDRLFLYVSHTGKIGYMIDVELTPPPTSELDHMEMGMLPKAHLNSTFLLGSDDSERAAMAGLLAVQIGSFVTSTSKVNLRSLMLAISLAGGEQFWHQVDNEEQNSYFHAVLELAGSVCRP